MYTVGKNIAANILGRVWSIISIYVFVPIWIHFLGLEAYGVITFYTVLLTILTFADAGLTATLSREFARNSETDPSYKQNLLRTFEYLYIGICFTVIIAVYFAAPLIVKSFLKSNIIPFVDLVSYIRIMGGVIAVYLLYSLYQGGLMGLQKQVCSNVINISYSVTRSGLVLFPLLFSNNLHVFLIWQLFSVLIFCIWSRFSLMRIINSEAEIHANFKYLKLVWQYAIGMMLMSILSSLNTQIDKLSVGNLLSLTDFSYYSLASTIGQVSLMLTMPIGLAFFPELIRLVTQKDYESCNKQFHKFAYLITSISSSVTIVILLYTYDYISIWTHNELIARTIEIPAKLLVFGTMFLSLQLSPYYLALANGHTKTNILVATVSVLLLIPMIYTFVPLYGLTGATIPWIFINFLGLTSIGVIILRRFLVGELHRWIVQDILLPIAISIVVGSFFYFVFYYLPRGYWTILYGVTIFLCVIGVQLYIFIRRYPKYLNLKIFNKLNKK